MMKILGAFLVLGALVGKHWSNYIKGFVPGSKKKKTDSLVEFFDREFFRANFLTESF
jgi:hypothetical protein